MSKGGPTKGEIIAHVFHGTAIDWSGGANFYVALHSAEPDDNSDQTTAEATYSGYARVAVSRDSGGWDLAGRQASNAAPVTFPECTGGDQALTHFSIGLEASGASQIVHHGPLQDTLNITSAHAPRFPAGTLVLTED